jgi:hypothetical protein
MLSRPVFTYDLVGPTNEGVYEGYHLTDVIWWVPFGTLQVLFLVTVIAVTGGVTGGLVGALGGGISGAATGLLTGIITTVAPITYANLRQFRVTIGVAGTLFTGTLALVLGPMMFRIIMSSRAGGDLPGSWLVQALLPALLAGVGAWWASRRVAGWYESDYLDSSAAAG